VDFGADEGNGVFTCGGVSVSGLLAFSRVGISTILNVSRDGASTALLSTVLSSFVWPWLVYLKAW